MEQVQDSEYIAYQQLMIKTENATYFDYLVSAYPYGYSEYRNLSLNLSFIEFLERYDIAGYSCSLYHDYQYKSFSLSSMNNYNPDLPVINITREDAANSSILSAHFFETPRYDVKVLPSKNHSSNRIGLLFTLCKKPMFYGIVHAIILKDRLSDPFFR